MWFTTSQPPPSTTSDAPRAVRFRPSATNEWDRMPAEIQNMILEHAGVLTLWLNGRIDIANLHDKRFNSMLRDICELDWQGDFRTLPFERFRYYARDECFWNLRSRSLHTRFKALALRALDNGLDQAAILNGWTDLLDFHSPRWIGQNAARCGSISMLQHLVDERKVVALDKDHARLAAEFGQLDVLKRLHERMPDGSWTTEAMDWAANKGHFNVVKWLHANRSEGCTTDAMDWAASNGHLEVVEFLHNHRTEGCTTRAMDFAVFNFHLDVLEWLHNNRTEGCTSDAMEYAARHNDADIVEFLYKNRTEGDIVNAATVAATGGQHLVLQRIRELAPSVIGDAFADEASSLGHSFVMQ
ncbi:hypothetical protein HK105_208050 [Polyrhizophydium stewartii]|uniref:Ankyrin repeat protein n=1 Tax=Polyrhizophydium stewartii TaxID=2732419 RepID=A0ABR4MYW5_9FUNG